MAALFFWMVAVVQARAVPQWEQTSGYYIVRGIVTDSITGEGLPYASVTPAEATGGTVADGKGVFEFKVSVNTKALHVAMMGYRSKVVPLKQTSHNMYAVRLSPSTTELKEVVVRRKKYSKKNNPAVDFVRSIKEHAPETSPERHDYYNHRKYERITIAVNNFEPSDSGALLRKMPFLAQHVDTSEVSGKPVLPLSVHETLSRYDYRRRPRSEKTTILGTRSVGIEEMMVDRRSTQTYFEDLFPEIDLFDNDINLLQYRFVSPLSRIGVDFYKFYLTDTVEVDGERCIVLSFYPHNTAAFGFTGHLYVPEGDTTMFITRVDMRAPRGINLNDVNALQLSQSFVKSPDGTRLKTRDDLVVEARFFPATPEMYVRRLSMLDSHSFDAPADSSLFSNLGRTLRSDSADLRSDEWWNEARLKPVDPRGEGRVGLLMKRLRSMPLLYWGEKFLRALIVGYVPTGNPCKVEIGPINTFVSYNSIDGLRLGFGGITTANLSKRLFARLKGAYGFRDHRWKYYLELDCPFNEKEYHSHEFPVHGLRFNSSYDLDFIGQHYYFTNPDNIFLSLKRRSDRLATYSFKNRISYIMELQNNFSVKASVGHEQQYATPMVPFVDGTGRSHGHFGATSLNVELRYAPGEKFYQTTSQRVPINFDAPVFSLRHTLALRGFMGSRFGINKTEFSFRKRIWMSVLGYLDTMVEAGKVWDRSVFTALLMPNANLSYTIQPESFALINPMEFVNDSQFNWELTYWANGAVFNWIPLVKKLRLREVVSYRGVWGSLSDRNDPSLHPELLRFPPGTALQRMDHGPYMELSAGIDNIYGCFRIDYVWRLNYRHVPYDINRSGVRISFHSTF